MAKAKSAYVMSIIALHFLFFVSAGLAQDVTWVTVEGRALIEDISKEEARTRAIENAMRKAVHKAVGADVTAEGLLINFRLSGGIVEAVPYGKVVEKEVIQEGEEEAHQEGHERPSLIYKVKMKAGVVEETGGADPDFRLDASLNQSSFTDGDEMLLSIKSTKDCHVGVFIILDDEKIIRLIPNRFKRDNSLTANETFSFPDQEDKERGVKLKAHMPGGNDAVTETIYILALKQPLTFDTTRYQEGIYGVYDGQTAFMQDLVTEIVSIPRGERAEKLLQYEIKKQESPASAEGKSSVQ